MKTQLTGLAGILFLLSMASCEKSTELDMDALTMELESCKPNKKNLKVGMEYQGGIIFYLDETGKHGLIVAKEDVGPAPWGCYGTFIPGLEGEDSKIATKILLANCKEPGIAARLCAKYEVREKGENGRVYKDWYMAGVSEYSKIINALGRSANMCEKTYWSFVEVSNFLALPYDPAKYVLRFSVSCTVDTNPKFSWGLFPGPTAKNNKVLARPIRDF